MRELGLTGLAQAGSSFSMPLVRLEKFFQGRDGLWVVVSVEQFRKARLQIDPRVCCFQFGFGELCFQTGHHIGCRIFEALFLQPLRPLFVNAHHLLFQGGVHSQHPGLAAQAVQGLLHVAFGLPVLGPQLTQRAHFFFQSGCVIGCASLVQNRHRRSKVSAGSQGLGPFKV